MEHTPEPVFLFHEMTRVLAPQGTMIQHVPFSFRLHEEPHDYYRFSSHALKYLCEKNNLEIQKLIPMGSLWSTINHKLITFLTFKVLRFSKLAQSLNKLGMERKQTNIPRYWLLPLAVPLIFILVILNEFLEKFCPIEGDHLGFLLVAKKIKN